MIPPYIYFFNTILLVGTSFWHSHNEQWLLAFVFGIFSGSNLYLAWRERKPKIRPGIQTILALFSDVAGWTVGTDGSWWRHDASGIQLCADGHITTPPALEATRAERRALRKAMAKCARAILKTMASGKGTLEKVKGEAT